MSHLSLRHVILMIVIWIYREEMMCRIYDPEQNDLLFYVSSTSTQRMDVEIIAGAWRRVECPLRLRLTVFDFVSEKRSVWYGQTLRKDNDNASEGREE